MLVDTHVMLWLVSGDDRLGPRARSALVAAPERLASTASLWEAAIKVQIGKLAAPETLPDLVTAAGLEWLPIDAHHAWGIRTLRGLPHRDPFDRLLLAQAHAVGVPLLTADRALLTADLHPAIPRVDARV